MIICTLINLEGKKAVAYYDAKVPPFNLIANGKLYAVLPSSWSSTDERLANLSPTYNQVFCPDVSNDLQRVPEPEAEVAA